MYINPALNGQPENAIKRCLHCNYLLQGLPNQGYCPECGYSFDKAAGAWRDGATLVMVRDGCLPQRCVKCNADHDVRMFERTLNWHALWIYLLILVNLLVYIIVGLILRKKARVSMGLCPTCLGRLRWRKGVTWILVAGSAGLFVFSFAVAEVVWGVVGFILFFVALFWWVLACAIVAPRRIDAKLVRLSGCGIPFLMSLPDWSASAASPPPVMPMPGRLAARPRPVANSPTEP